MKAMGKSEGREKLEEAARLLEAEKIDSAKLMREVVIAESLVVIAEELVRLNENMEKRWKDGHRL